MKIALILPAFYIGGFERWATFVYKALSSQNVTIDVFVLGNIEAHPKDFGINFELNKITFIGLFKIVFSSKYKYILTGLTKLNLLLSFLCLFSRKFVITSIHLSLHRKEIETPFKYRLRKEFHKYIYKFSNKIICVSNGIYQDYISISNDDSKLKVIYNPCFSISDIYIKKLNDSKNIVVSCAGRLCFQKGFDILIEAFNNMPYHSIANININLYGPDPDNLWPQLYSLIKLDRVNKFNYHGPVQNLHLKLRASDIFVLSSRYEGFGNVLAEALAADCFCISFNSPHGPSEILMNGRFGLLLNSISAVNLSNALTDVILAKKYLNRDYSSQERCNHLYKFSAESFCTNFSIMLNDNVNN